MLMSDDMRNELQTFAKYGNVRDKWTATQLIKLERHGDKLARRQDKRAAAVWGNALRQQLFNNNSEYLRVLSEMHEVPVTVEQFINDPEYLGNLMTIWPKLQADMKRICPDILAGEPSVNEVLNASCIGTGKSILGEVATLYWMYFLSCCKHPQRVFPNLSDYTPLVFVLQSVRETVTRRVLYEPMRQMFLDIPWVRKNVIYDRDKESTLVLENGIVLAPMLATTTAFIGQAVINAVIDEANFMLVVDESKRIYGPEGVGGLYDQAEEVYHALDKRRASRAITRGPSPGVIYLSSSVNYKGDFLERRIASKVEGRDDQILVFRYQQYDVKPEGSFSGEFFNFLVGTNDYGSKVIEPEETDPLPTNAQIEKVPVEFIRQFRNDPEKSQRDFLGIPTSSINRYITQTHKIVDAIQRGREIGLTGWFRDMNVELAVDGMPQIDESKLPDDRRTPRFVHFDLSSTGDNCGMAIVKAENFTTVSVNGVAELLPELIVETVVTIKPNRMNPIDLPELRRMVLQLKTYYGINIICVTYDGYHSQESIQLFRKAGIMSYEISMDKTIEPYEDFRQALYQGRVWLPDNDLVKNEFAQLEKHTKGGKSKVDHPVKGSKDGADAVVGACRAASQDRAIRVGTKVVDPLGNPVSPSRRSRDVVRRDPTRR